MVFFSRLPRSRLGSLAFAVSTCFLLVGMVASTCGGIRGCFSVDCFVRWFLPDSSAWVPVYLVSWALAFGAIASVKFRLWQLPQPLLFFTSCACLVSSETSASWVLTVASAPDSERAFAFGHSLCSVSSSTPSSLVASWCGGLGACLPFFPFPFGVVVTPGLMARELEGFFPSGCFLFQLWGCPASSLAVAGKGGSVLRAHPFFGTVAWCLFKSLLFPSYATRCACLGLRPCGECL